MKYKEAFAEDVRNVFLNTDEFAEEVELNGVMIKAKLREESSSDSNVNNEWSREVIDPSLPESMLVLYASTEDIPDGVKRGKTCTVNGRQYGILYRGPLNQPLTRLELVRQGY